MTFTDKTGPGGAPRLSTHGSVLYLPVNLTPTLTTLFSVSVNFFCKEARNKEDLFAHTDRHHR